MTGLGLAVLALAGALALGLRGVPHTPEVPAGQASGVAGFTVTRGPGGALSLVAADGDRLELQRPAQRVASMILLADEVLLELAPERLLTISKVSTNPLYSDVAEQLAALGRPSAERSEQLLALRPELVIAASYTAAERLDRLRALGLPVLVLRRFGTLRELRENIELIGLVIGREAQAAALLRRMDARIAAAVARIPAGSRPRVVSHEYGNVHGTGTSFDEVITLAGGINIAREHDLSGWPKVSGEQVASWRPDAVVISAPRGEAEAARAAYLAANPLIARLGARVIVIDSARMTAVSHHIAAFVEDAVRELHE